nr:unnamed protein product [Callosobruchus analis]
MLGCIQLLATILCAVSIERVARKILLMASCVVMVLASMIIGIYIVLKSRNIERRCSPICRLHFASSWYHIFIIAFSMGLGPIPWMAPVVFFPRSESICTAAAILFNWLLAFLPQTDSIGSDKTFFIFAAISASGVFFTLFVVPETKGKTFNEIVRRCRRIENECNIILLY